MMTRRDLLLAGSAAAYALPAGFAQSPASRYSHRLPASDQNYARSRSYIEDTPIPEYRWASDAAYERFRDLKFGVRIHWGIYTLAQTRRTSWAFLEMPYAERQRYNQLYRTWNPTGFDADAWMDLFRECGMKMFAFTTKHHEGFSLFDSKTRVRRRVNWAARGGPRMEDCDLAYSVMETPFRRDIVRELCAAARRRGIRIDLYFSHTDFYDADFRPYGYHPLQVPSSPQLTNAQAPEGDPPELERARGRLKDLLWTAPDPTPEETRRMIARHRGQLLELVNNYGPIDMLCLDIWLGKTVWPEMRKTLLEIRKAQPDVMLRARGIGNYGDYYTPEGFVPGSQEPTDVPWFVIHALASSGWAYEPDGARYKPAGWIVHSLVDSVCKGGNFMVGIGPDATGRFHPTAVARLKETGEWLKVNGEAIYGSRARTEWKEGERIRLNRSADGRFVYAHCLAWPGRGLNLKSVRLRPDEPVTMLGSQAPVRAVPDAASGLSLEIPESLQSESNRPCSMAWVFRIPAQDTSAVTVADSVVRGKLLLEDNFTAPETYTREFQPVAPGWEVRAWQADWRRSAAGVESVWTTGHMPVLAYRGAFRDVIIELEFRFEHEDGRKAVCRISATNPELNPRAYSVSAWANVDSKERAQGMVLEHDEWKPGVITTVDNRPAQFEPGRWYSMRLAVVGDHAWATANGVTVSGSHEKFGLPKTLIALGTGLSRHELRRLRVYEAKRRD